MPSDALLVWQTNRIPRLQNVEADCLHLEVLHAADPDRVQEYIRSYAVLLSSEFQGFCRNLHSECADRLVDSVHPVALRGILRSQCVYGRKLDGGNANAANLARGLQPLPLRLLARCAGARPWPRTETTSTRYAERLAKRDRAPRLRPGRTRRDDDLDNPSSARLAVGLRCLRQRIRRRIARPSSRRRRIPLAALKGDTAMPDLDTKSRYKVGDEVRLITGSRLVGRVTEVRRSSSQAARFLYRVRVVMNPEPLMLEVREDEVEKA